MAKMRMRIGAPSQTRRNGRWGREASVLGVAVIIGSEWRTGAISAR